MTDFHDSLNQALEDSYKPDNFPPETTEEGQEREPWKIQDMDSAAWASRKLKPNYEQRASVKAWAKAEIERIKEIEKLEMNRLENDASYLEFSLRAFLSELISEGRKTKSLDLPGGKFSLTKRQPELTYDEQQLIKFAQENSLDEILSTKVSINKTALKKNLNFTEEGALITKDGLILPGEWMNQPDSHTFTPNTVKTKDAYGT